MIKGVVMLADDTHVFESYFNHPPRVGEYLWSAGGDGGRIYEAHGTTAFVVKEIAHWCLPGHIPANVEATLHSLAIYVEPLKRKEDDEA